MRPVLTWQSITVQHFLDIYRMSLNTDLDEMEKLEKIICILFDMTEQEVDNLSMGEFTQLSKEVGFILQSDIPGKPVRRIKIGNRRYDITYDPTKLRHRQYVELIHFGDKPIENMHLIMASVVEPVTWYGKRLKNRANRHEVMAADMLQARVMDVYHSSVFFCKVYVSLILNIKDSLVLQMMQTGTSKARAEELITASLNVMAGFIPQSNLQTLKT
jgi:hypothetical protein